MLTTCNANASRLQRLHHKARRLKAGESGATPVQLAPWHASGEKEEGRTFSEGFAFGSIPAAFHQGSSFKMLKTCLRCVTTLTFAKPADGRRVEADSGVADFDPKAPIADEPFMAAAAD